jgi:hypothetical protein
MPVRLNENHVMPLMEIGAFAIALIALAWLKSEALTFANFGPSDVLTRLTPLILTSAFIERTVEVLISPWRDPEANRQTTAIQTAKAAPEPDDAATAQKLQNVAAATDALTAYTGTTQRYAYLTGLTLGLVASLAGLSALRPFLVKDALNALSPLQHNLFAGFDITLTAALLAGGADGLHSIISAFTSFFSATADRVSNPT